MNSEKSLQMENENFISQLWAVGSGRRGILFANLINCWLASEEKPRIQRSAFGRHQFSVVVHDNDDDDQIIIIILLRNCEKWQHQKKKKKIVNGGHWSGLEILRHWQNEVKINEGGGMNVWQKPKAENWQTCPFLLWIDKRERIFNIFHIEFKALRLRVFRISYSLI